MAVQATPFARQLLRDERKPRIERIKEITRAIAGCYHAGSYEASVVMQFIELDTWAYLARPAVMTKHGRTSFKWLIRTYLKSDPGQPYQYNDEDAYAARSGCCTPSAQCPTCIAINPCR